jgi:hypothetical protein
MHLGTHGTRGWVVFSKLAAGERALAAMQHHALSLATSYRACQTQHGGGTATALELARATACAGAVGWSLAQIHDGKPASIRMECSPERCRRGRQPWPATWRRAQSALDPPWLCPLGP